MKTKLLFLRILSLLRLDNICAHIFSEKIDWRRLLLGRDEVCSLMKQGMMVEVTTGMPYFCDHSYRMGNDSYRILSQ